MDWINVEDQMPEPYATVWTFVPADERRGRMEDWVCIHRYRPIYVDYARGDTAWEHKFGPGCHLTAPEVTHWKPFKYPDPPTRKE